MDIPSARGVVNWTMAFQPIGVFENLLPGRALDLAAGSGRHSLWLAHRGWTVTAVDREILPLPQIETVTADLERHEYRVAPDAWDLIVCWLYWQEDLMPLMAAGVRPGGVVALAGKTTGRFATSLDRYRSFLPGWEELEAGEDEGRGWLIARRPKSLIIS